MARFLDIADPRVRPWHAPATVLLRWTVSNRGRDPATDRCIPDRFKSSRLFQIGFKWFKSHHKQSKTFWASLETLSIAFGKIKIWGDLRPAATKLKSLERIWTCMWRLGHLQRWQFNCWHVLLVQTFAPRSISIGNGWSWQQQPRVQVSESPWACGSSSSSSSSRGDLAPSLRKSATSPPSLVSVSQR